MVTDWHTLAKRGEEREVGKGHAGISLKVEGRDEEEG